MNRNSSSRPPAPTGLLAWFYRQPIHIYRMGLGWLMPKRLLFLTHIGRKSGQPRYTVIEVADHDAERDIYYVISGYAKKAQWYKNLAQTPQAKIQVGRRKVKVSAELLSEPASGDAVVAYARKYPRAAKILLSTLGFEPDGSEEMYRKIGEEGVSAVAFHVQSG